jgi:hypothetical protein
MKYNFEESMCLDKNGKEITIPAGLHSVGDDKSYEWVDIILDPPHPSITLSIEHEVFQKLKDDGYVTPFL